MLDIEKTPNGHRLLDVIRIIAFHGESGRLQMSVGLTRGVFFFKNGRLVEARLGSLIGFQAINVAVSMGEAHFSFEPSNTPTFSSSITPNERTILKQFFDIETVDPECDHHVRVPEPDWDITPAAVVPLSDVDVLEFSQEDAPENTAVVDATRAEDKVIPSVPEATPDSGVNVDRDVVKEERLGEPLVVSGLLSSASRQRVSLYLIMLVALTAALALALVHKLSVERLPSVAKQSEPEVATQAAQQVAKPSEPTATQSSTSLQVPQRQSDQGEQGRTVAQNLTGQWNVVNTVQKTAYRPFDNLKIGFRLVIDQTGSEFTASGEKVSENGRSLPVGSRTPIHVVGSIEGDKVKATFFEQGTVRKTNGRFEWRIQGTGSGLAGIFVTDAARSSGKSAATRTL